VQTRFTFGPSDNKLAVWSPDGGRIAYSSMRQSGYSLYVASASRSGTAEPLFASDAQVYPTDWSRDGRYIAITTLDPKGQTRYDIWVVPMVGDRKPFPYLQTPFNETDAVFSPDSHWRLAYVSDESGKAEVYLSSFPGGGGKWQVSRGGGGQPEWNRDGSALYYVGPGGKMMEASIKTKSTTAAVGAPRELFEQPMAAASVGGRNYYVSGDGKRFLLVEAPPRVISPFTLVTNWPAELKK